MKTYVVVPDLKRIGYHRLSDNSVTCFCVPKSSTETVIGGLKQDFDIDRIWTREDSGAVDYYCDKKFGGNN